MYVLLVCVADPSQSELSLFNSAMLRVGTEPSAGTSSVWKRQEVTSQWPALESAHTWRNRPQCSRANYSPANRSGSPQNGARWGWDYLHIIRTVPQHLLSFWHHSLPPSVLQCSRSCGDGVQTREVRCLTVDKQHSSACDLESKPAHEQACNTIPCGPFEGALLFSFDWEKKYKYMHILNVYDLMLCISLQMTTVKTDGITV